MLTGFVFLPSLAFAQTPYFSLSYSGNVVYVNVNGDANASVYFYYHDGNNNLQQKSIYLGSTNNNGYLSAALNTNTYNVPNNDSVYVTVNGVATQYLQVNTLNQSYNGSNVYYLNQYPNYTYQTQSVYVNSTTPYYNYDYGSYNYNPYDGTGYNYGYYNNYVTNPSGYTTAPQDSGYYLDPSTYSSYSQSYYYPYSYNTYSKKKSKRCK